ncbi:MAG: 1-acyl-sn-glycerol-3-phosphate acyltransferase [Clostridiales bacterium]|nr:1-acyl-sn-glycerol-3-phosphate acyltransferase [Clostridiales bacterium]
MLYYIFRPIIALFFWLIFRPKVSGGKALRTRGKVIFVCNHFSLGDPITLACLTRRQVHFMAKSDLLHKWYAKIFFKLLLAFPVARHSADLGSIRTALNGLAKGKAFGIFPQGRRVKGGELTEPEKGAAFIALRADAPIVPVYLDPRIWRRLRCRAAVGDPIYPADAKTSGGKPVDVLTEMVWERMKELEEQVKGIYKLQTTNYN